MYKDSQFIHKFLPKINVLTYKVMLYHWSSMSISCLEYIGNLMQLKRIARIKASVICVQFLKITLSSVL